MRRSLAWASALALVLASLAGLLMPASAQETAPPSGVGGYSLTATAAATKQIFKPENNIVPTEKLLDVSVPYASTALSQGSGYALGVIAWPGDTFANACGAFPNGFPDPGDPNFSWYPPDAPRIPIPCDTYRAESFFPQGPADSKPPQEVPGTTSVSHADEKESTAKGEITPVGGPGASIGALSSASSTSIKTGAAVAEATSRVSDIVLADGVIRIQSIISQAKAVSDGATADAQGSTVIQGFTIADVAVSVTADGVTIAGQAPVNPLGSVIDPVNAALETLGISISLSKPVVTKDGAVASVDAPGLRITFDNTSLITSIPPELRSNLPIDPTGTTTLVFGQASASTDASPGFADDLGPIEDLPIVEDIAPELPEDLGPGDSVALTTEASPEGETAAAPTGAVVQAANRRLVDGKAVGLGLVLMAMVGSVAAAVGLHRLGTGLFEPIAVTACPQEKP
jgi:hypothetical protein